MLKTLLILKEHKDRPESQRIDNNTAFEMPITQPASKDASRATIDAMQSVSILKTPWGELVDDEPDMSDDEQETNLEGELEEGSIFTHFMSRSRKNIIRNMLISSVIKASKPLVVSTYKHVLKRV
jgi:hypothetical protein